MSNLKIKVAISIVALSLIISRLIWPEIKVDGITIGLAVVAIIPWLTSIVESMKFPGGWEIKLRDVSAAGAKVATEIQTTADRTQPPILTEGLDPNLAMVELRIEIEKRLRKLAALNGVEENRSLSSLSVELRKREILTDGAFTGLLQMVSAGNQAAHGASVEPSLSAWASSQGNAVLSSLDEIIREQSKN